MTCKLACFDAFNLPLISWQVFNPANKEVALSWIVQWIYFLVLIQWNIDHMAKTTFWVKVLLTSKREINKLWEYDICIHYLTDLFTYLHSPGKPATISIQCCYKNYSKSKKYTFKVWSCLVKVIENTKLSLKKYHVSIFFLVDTLQRILF